MKVWNGLLIAFSMYSRIPVPKADWKEENMRYAMCFFPMVGGVLGVLFLGVWKLCALFQFHAVLTAVLLVLLPVTLTGGIHMDGLMDTMDALGSCQTKEKKLEILKDSRAGAFAVLACSGYLLLDLGILHEIVSGGVGGAALGNLAMGFLLSRTLSGLSVLTFPCAKTSGLAASFAENAAKQTERIVMVLYLALSGAVMICLDGKTAISMWIAAFLTFYGYRRMSLREFGGITGDLAGFFLQTCELFMAAAWLLGTRV